MFLKPSSFHIPFFLGNKNISSKTTSGNISVGRNSTTIFGRNESLSSGTSKKAGTAAPTKELVSTAKSLSMWGFGITTTSINTSGDKLATSGAIRGFDSTTAFVTSSSDKPATTYSTTALGSTTTSVTSSSEKSVSNSSYVQIGYHYDLCFRQ